MGKREKNSSLVMRGLEIARKISAKRKMKGVTSPMVWKVLREEAKTDEDLAILLQARDPRWMGKVFSSAEWYRLGYTRDADQGGSHGRPVAIWIRQPSLFE